MLAVNTPKVVCAVAHVAYVKGNKVGELKTQDGHFNLVEIVVVGVPTAGGVRPVNPEKQVAIFRPKGQDT